jgi:hypothetical protein
MNFPTDIHMSYHDRTSCGYCGNMIIYDRRDDFKIGAWNGAHPICRKCFVCGKRALLNGKYVLFVKEDGKHCRCDAGEEITLKEIGKRYYKIQEGKKVDLY